MGGLNKMAGVKTMNEAVDRRCPLSHLRKQILVENGLAKGNYVFFLNGKEHDMNERLWKATVDALAAAASSRMGETAAVPTATLIYSWVFEIRAGISGGGKCGGAAGGRTPAGRPRVREEKLRPLKQDLDLKKLAIDHLNVAELPRR